MGDVAEKTGFEGGFGLSLDSLPKDTAQAKEWVMGQASSHMKTLRSWGEFFDRHHFKLPSDAASVSSRIISNYSYFQTNYLLIFIVVSLYSIFSNPMFLVSVFAVLGLWVYAFMYSPDPLVLGGMSINEQQKTYGLGAITLLLFWFTSTGSTLLWIFMFSLSLITAHAVIYNRSTSTITSVEPEQDTV
eukprot:TRINITY_DN2448_c0_g1_i2.p1 TRINITY_DN2448_c0_g1~~TRINITY_DN2448_c0_g1_i2.p1  ORF type:complete len:188 (+),score=2.66 TRINITY_DN2448_c0_g1_i2:39-602(+)